jgi:hypothetical protein
MPDWRHPRRGAAMAAVAATLVLPLATAAETAREQRFEFVTTMPDAQGERARSVDRVDAESGLRIVKDVFSIDAGPLRILTHVARVACSVDGPSRPYILAIQYQPKAPQTFAQATLYDTYEEVYVTDDEDRVRLYRRVTGADMLRLTERFLPACPAI